MPFTRLSTRQAKNGQRRLSHRPLRLDELERREMLTTFTVTSSADSGAGSLRDAVEQADLMPGPDIVEFDSALNGQTIQLNSVITIRDGVSIVGPGSDQLTIDAQELSRHFRVSVVTPGDVEFSGLTLVRGRATTGSGGSIGSLLQPSHVMRLTDLVMSDNATLGPNASGGAVYSLSPLEIRDSVITGNSTGGMSSPGGAISGGFEITIVDSQISNNQTMGHYSPGGGIGISSAAVYVYDSQISGNTTYGDYSPGGGVYTQVGGYLQRTTINGNATHGNNSPGGGLVGYGAIAIDSTVSNNATHGNDSPGGGVFSWAYLEVSQSTISTNATSALSSPGGGVYVYGFANFSRSTVTGNSAAVAPTGGGISAAGALTIDSSIVADNSADAVAQDLDSVSISATYSLIGSNRLTSLPEAPVGSPDIDGNLIGDPDGQGVIDPMLAPLSDNGGPTSTHFLLSGSPAIDAGSLFPPGFFDQRGTPFARFRNAGPDMGAYEVQALPGHLGDGVYDCSDIDLVVAQIASGIFNPQLDFTGDGRLNIDDVAAWLAEAGDANLGPGRAYLFGDANLDGDVDGLDFLVWNTNKFTANPAWCAGDFDADGLVSGLDFIIWNQNKFQSADVKAPSVKPTTRASKINRSPSLPDRPATTAREAKPANQPSFKPRSADDGLVQRAAPPPVRFSSFDADEVFKRQDWL